MSKAGNRILSFTFTLVLLLGMTLKAVGVEIQSWQSTSITANDTAANTTVIGFGGYEWYVIGHDGIGVYSTMGDNTATLLLKTGETAPRPYPDSQFNSSFTHVYSGSILQTAMDNAYNSLTDSREKALVIPRDFAGGATYNDGSDNIAGPAVSNAYFWPLSVNEANLVNSVRTYSYYWWLRSPGFIDYYAAAVYANGGVFASGNNVVVTYAIRPAFNLDLSSVIFTSAAVGGKSSVGVTGTLTSAQAPTGAVKLTVLDSGLNLDVTAITGAASRPGDTVSIPYTGATLTADYISCIITQQDGTVLYYGKLDNGGNASGTASFSVPAGLADGDYIIKLFAENCNGNNETDYASDPVAIGLTVDRTLTDAELTVTPPTFAPVTLGYGRPAAQSITIANSGDVAATITSVAVDNTAAFEINGSGSVVPANGSVASWTVQPMHGLTVGSYSGTITVTYTGGPSHPVTDTATANVYFTVNPVNAYTLTIQAGTGGSIIAGANGQYMAGDIINIAATADSGYTFSEWTSTGGGSFVSSGSGATTFTMPSNAATITANFTYMGGGTATPTPILILTKPTDNTAWTGVYYSNPLSVYYDGTGTLIYSATGLPSGLSINSDTGVISGAPTATGAYTVTATVTDNTLIDSKSYTLTVRRQSGGGSSGGLSTQDTDRSTAPSDTGEENAAPETDNTPVPHPNTGRSNTPVIWPLLLSGSMCGAALLLWKRQRTKE